MSEAAIRLENVAKAYSRFVSPADRLRNVLLPKRYKAQPFWALRDISIEVPMGQTVGILGRNGSGKSTLLQIVAGTMTPTSGRVHVNGRVSALLELGSGFNPEFTGRQNVFFTGRLLGLTLEEITARFDEIAAFADIGDFLEYPVKTYSSGMTVRLAFSVAISVNPQILIIDEALAVGDARFQQKCMTRIKQLRNNGVSILFVSHDSEAIKRLCDYGIVLESGRIVNEGNPVHMANWYLSLITVNFDLEKQRAMEAQGEHRNELAEIVRTPVEAASHGTVYLEETADHVADTRVFENSDVAVKEDPQLSRTGFEDDFKFFRHGDGNARIVNVLVRNSSGEVTDSVFLGETICIEFHVDFLTDQDYYVIGFSLKDRLGTDIISLNTFQEKVVVPEARAGSRMRYQFITRLDVRPGAYGLTVGLAYNQFEMQYMDWVENSRILKVSDTDLDRIVFGVYLPAARKVICGTVAQPRKRFNQEAQIS